MGSIRLYAIAIGELRDFFAAPPELAARLRRVAATDFGEPKRTPSAGRLGQLGPLVRVPPGAPVVAPDVPTGVEVAQLLSGQYVPPHRRAAAWRLLASWLRAESWGRLVIELDAAQLAAFDFDLSRAGVSSQFALGGTVREGLGVPLSAVPGLAAGYVPGPGAKALAAAWRPVLPELTPEHRALGERVLDWLAGFDAWTAGAAAVGRPAPDLVVVLRF